MQHLAEVCANTGAHARLSAFTTPARTLHYSKQCTASRTCAMHERAAATSMPRHVRSSQDCTDVGTKECSRLEKKRASIHTHMPTRASTGVRLSPLVPTHVKMLLSSSFSWLYIRYMSSTVKDSYLHTCNAHAKHAVCNCGGWTSMGRAQCYLPARAASGGKCGATCWPELFLGASMIAPQPWPARNTARCRPYKSELPPHTSPNP